MTPLVKHEAPDFKAKALMPDDSVADVTLSASRGRYVALVFYPKDSTSVCSSEIVAYEKRLDDFKARDCDVIAISVDPIDSHRQFKSALIEAGQISGVRFPIASDEAKSIARDYGILFDDKISLRALFLIDPKGIVRHAVINDMPLGRDVDESLRMLDAVRHVDTRGEACMANWRAKN